MRTPADTSNEWDLKEQKRVNAEDWQLKLLELNPGYTFWGPYEDYMCSGKKKGEFVRNREGELDFKEFSPEEVDKQYGNGWREPLFYDGWDSFNIELDELNEVVNFYFEVSRASKSCEPCNQVGLNPATTKIYDDWYDFANTGRKWCHKITDNEVKALVEAGRLKDLTSTFVPGEGWVDKDPPYMPSAAEVNEWSRNGFGHDAINHHICVEARAKKEGVYGLCELCEGKGYVYTEPKAHVNLVLWLIHPRKGAGRGVEVKNIQKENLPEVFTFLNEAAKRNADRFAKVVGL